MLRFLIITVVAAAMAAPHEGACPAATPVENFNVTAGVWYEISKIPLPSEGRGQCAQAEYTLNGEEVKVKNSHVLDGEQKYIEGTARFAPDANNAAKLIVTFKFGDFVAESPLLVLTTDYTNYSIAYNCNYDENTKTHNEHAWILSRTKQLEGEAKTAVDTFLKEHSNLIDSSKLLATDFSEEACKFTSSSVMTQPMAKP